MPNSTIDRKEFKVDLRTIVTVSIWLALGVAYYVNDHKQIYINSEDIATQGRYDKVCETRYQDGQVLDAMRDSDIKHIKEGVDDIKQLLKEEFGSPAGL